MFNPYLASILTFLAIFSNPLSAAISAANNKKTPAATIKSLFNKIATLARPLSAKNGSNSPIPTIESVMENLIKAQNPPKRLLVLKKPADQSQLINTAIDKLKKYIEAYINTEDLAEFLSHFNIDDFHRALSIALALNLSDEAKNDLKVSSYEPLINKAQAFNSAAKAQDNDGLNDLIKSLQLVLDPTDLETRPSATKPPLAQTTNEETPPSRASTSGLSDSIGSSQAPTPKSLFPAITPHTTDDESTNPRNFLDNVSRKLQFDKTDEDTDDNQQTSSPATAIMHTKTKKSHQANSSHSPEISSNPSLSNCSILSVIALTGGATLQWISSRQAKLAKQIIRNHQEIVASWNGLPTTMKVGRLGLSRSEASTLSKILTKHHNSDSSSWQPTNKINPCHSNTIQKILKKHIQAYRRQAIWNTAVSAGAIAALAAAGWSFATTAIAKS